MAYAMFVFYIVALIVFCISFGPAPLPNWMIYRSAIFFLYAAVHIFLCLLHFYMGMLERITNIRGDHGFGRVKLIILSIIIFGLALSGFVLLLLENKGVSSYSDEDDLVFERRHSVLQMRSMMICLNAGCAILNTFFALNFCKMVSRANRSKGSTKWIHYFALFINIILIFMLLGMIVAMFYPTEIEAYRYLQDAYFAL